MAGKVFFSVSMSLDGFIAPGSLGDLMGQHEDKSVGLGRMALAVSYSADRSEGPSLHGAWS